MDDDEEEGEKGGTTNSNNNGGAPDPSGGVAGLYGWPSSRIVRVSRATGGKDRHSKVLTSRGLRDRRVRLSVNTAIQFYDLQDRLGYDQPSKAVEWLLAAAADSIAELPPMKMDSPFPFANKLLPPTTEERKSSSGADNHRMMTVMDGAILQEAAAAAGSSSSENSKGSGLSISRSGSRLRARERAKERALEKERENHESSYVASFTELLSGGGISSVNGVNKDVSVCRDQSPINNGNSDHQSTNFFNKFSMDYFSNGNPVPPAPLQFSDPELQPPFSFASDSLASANSSAVNRGTLQSNSSSSSSLQFHPNIFTSDAGNYRHFLPGFDARLQLYYGDAHGNDVGGHSDPKRKDKP